MQKSMFALAILSFVLSGGHAMGQGSGSSRVQSQGSGSSRVSPPRSSQSNRSNSTVPTSPRPPTVTQFAAAFWKHLNSPQKPYRQWGTPGKTSRQGEPPTTKGQADNFHRDVGQTFLNNLANHNLQRLPLSSILVREEFAADGQTLKNLTVMYRAKTADPKHGNWYWMVYGPNGSLATMSSDQGNRPVAGRVSSCVECHRQAGGNDYVFLNDQSAPGTTQSVPPAKAPRAPSVNPNGSGARR